ncbi:MAG: hypothetical protein PHS54_05070 [Clostridia bacterium]|nr:hypothetical protein [Clostridia bacterium]
MKEDFELTSNEEIEETKEVDCKKYFEEIKKLANDMMTEIDYSTRLKKDIREEAYIMLDAIICACDIQNLKILNGLIVGFDFVSQYIRVIKFLYKEMKNLLINFYDELQG